MSSDIFDLGGDHGHDPLSDVGIKWHHDHQGNIIGHSEKNLLGGQHYFDNHGNFTGYSGDNILGGHDFTNAHGVHLGHTESHGGQQPFHHDDGHITQSAPQMIKFHDPFTHHQIHDHFSGMRTNLLGKIY